MADEINSIQSRISDIQARIASLTPATQTPQVAPTSATSPQTQSFQKTLNSVPVAPSLPLNPSTHSDTTLPAAPSSVNVTPASLGPLPVDPSSIVRISNSGTSDYQDLIAKYAAKNGLSPALVQAVIHTESGGDPKAVSPAGAMGLMQLMPANVREAGISDPFDPEQNIAAGTKQLADLMSHYHGDLDLTLAGYNAGPGNVRKYGGVPPFAETQNYIRKIRAAMERG